MKAKQNSMEKDEVKLYLEIRDTILKSLNLSIDDFEVDGKEISCKKETNNQKMVDRAILFWRCTIN